MKKIKLGIYHYHILVHKPNKGVSGSLVTELISHSNCTRKDIRYLVISFVFIVLIVLLTIKILQHRVGKAHVIKLSL